MPACKACGGQTDWDLDVGSNICTGCGTLEDASQVVLSNQLEPYELGSQRDRGFPGAALKSLRAPGWNLAGQSKEAREIRNKAAIHEFIKTLAIKLGHMGCIDRAKYLFDMAMSRGKLRWGRKAKLTAAAALAIACREDSKADPLRDLAVLISESSTTLARSYTLTAALVGCSALSSDPSLHLTTLKSHLLAVLQPSDDSGGASILPAALQKELAALRPQLLSVERTASQLCSLFGRLDTFTQLSTPSTACALFMLALEAEARKPLSASTALAGLLGARFGCAGTTVQGRYKAAYDIAESWTAELPWASMYKKMGSREKTARAKEGKRAVVAKSLKDAVAFQEAIWIKKVGMDKATLELEDDDNETASDSNSSAPSTVSSKRTLPGDDQMAEVAPFGYPRKRARTAQTGMDAASAFLLSPSTALATTARSSRSRLRTTTTTSEGSSLLTHLLSVDLCALSLSHPPTRLQLLGTTRDGADRVLDEELFEDGELEGMLRRPEEVDAFARTVDWPDDAPSSTKLGGASKPGPRVKAPKGRERLNMDRLTRLLGEPDTNESTDDGKNDMADAWEDFALLGGVAVLDEALVFDVDKDDDPANEPSSHLPSSTSIGMAEEDVEEWRPASPGGDGGDWCEF